MANNFIKENFEKIIDGFVVESCNTVRAEVAKARHEHPEFDQMALVDHFISRAALANGVVGGITSFGGITSAIATLPVNLYITTRNNVQLVMAVACISGYELNDERMVRDVLLVLAGDAGIRVLKEAGMALGNKVARVLLDKIMTKQLVRRINAALGIKLLAQTGQKGLLHVGKLVPLLGSAVGSAVDYFGCKAIGKTAKRYYLQTA